MLNGFNLLLSTKMEQDLVYHFTPPLHRKLIVTNNDLTIALKMKNAVFENNQYKLDAETCLVETVKFEKAI